jgi:polyribonucleotide nucleotidyltransferase
MPLSVVVMILPPESTLSVRTAIVARAVQARGRARRRLSSAAPTILQIGRDGHKIAAANRWQSFQINRQIELKSVTVQIELIAL